MGLYFWRKKEVKKVTIATSCWQENWREVLNKEPLQKNIENHQYPFVERLLVINNVTEKNKVYSAAKKLLEEKVFTKIVFSEEKETEVLSFFSLKKEEFVAKDARKEYQVANDWVFYNSLAPLTAIYHCQTPYLLYFTADAHLKKPLSWIEKALSLLEKDPSYKVANPLWNERKKEAKKEAFTQKKGFWISSQGFSDQMFLIKTEDFRKPIYSEIREDADHFPRGEVFEKRVYSYLKNRGYKRLTFKKGSYYHV